MTQVATTLSTLQDAYNTWLETNHPSKPGLKNKDRGVTDLLNYDRALRCFAMGASGGVSSLELVPVDMLNSNDDLLGRHLEKGAEALNARSNRAAPSEKTLKNLLSCLKAVQLAALGKNGQRPKAKSPKKIFEERPKRKLRAAFSRAAWPEALKRDWQGYAGWKTKAILSPEEGEHLRRKRCKEISVEAHAKRLNPYVGYLMNVLGKTDFVLTELCQTSLYTSYLNWYLALEADGGYHFAKDTGLTLAMISQYLVAQGRLPQAGANGKNIWDEFYRMSFKPLEVGAERAKLPEPKSIGDWKPLDLIVLANQAWDKEAPRYWRGDGVKRQKQLFARKRSGLFFALAYETPLRARNFREMRWGQNLKKLPDGRWQVLFRGQELKVARRGVSTNEYRYTYSKTTSRFIDRWREELTSYVGADFERRCPYVFVASTPSPQPMSHDGFKVRIANLVMELRGEQFNPHLVRHIVASYLVNEHGPGGLGLAAELLGDTVQMVLKVYYRPNTEQARQDYLLVREGKK